MATKVSNKQKVCCKACEKYYLSIEKIKKPHFQQKGGFDYKEIFLFVVNRVHVLDELNYLVGVAPLVLKLLLTLTSILE